ncbi:hypothetical protein, partial [Simplicispira metamorpha]
MRASPVEGAVPAQAPEHGLVNHRSDQFTHAPHSAAAGKDGALGMKSGQQPPPPAPEKNQAKSGIAKKVFLCNLSAFVRGSTDESDLP